MRFFTIPFVIDQEEKIFGGQVSIRQAIYLVLGVMSALIFYTGLPIAIKIIFFSSFATLMLLFAFLKIGNIYFDKFTLIVILYLLRKKLFLFNEKRQR